MLRYPYCLYNCHLSFEVALDHFASFWNQLGMTSYQETMKRVCPLLLNYCKHELSFLCSGFQAPPLSVITSKEMNYYDSLGASRFLVISSIIAPLEVFFLLLCLLHFTLHFTCISPFRNDASLMA